MTEELKPVRTEGFARECREIADALKVEYGQRRNRNGMPYLDFERHPYVGRAGALLRQATAIAAELDSLRATPAPAQPEPSPGAEGDEAVAWRAWDEHASRWQFTVWPGEAPDENWEELYLHPSRSAGAAAPVEGAASDAQITAMWNAMQERLTREKKAQRAARIGTTCAMCGKGKLFLDGNGYNEFERCDACGHVPFWGNDGKDAAAALSVDLPGALRVAAPTSPTPEADHG